MVPIPFVFAVLAKVATASVRCSRCGCHGHPHVVCPWPMDERDLDRGLPQGSDLDHWNRLGPSTAALHTGRNEREIGLVDGLGNS